MDFLRRKKIKGSQRKAINQELRQTPHKEMFYALRNEGGIKSIHELWKTKQLTTEILNIWEQTIDEMFKLSLNFEKMRYLCDTKHLYFIWHSQYDNWDDRLKIFMDTLAGINSINSFSVINPMGSIIFLNPLGEPVDTSHDEAIQKIFDDFFQKFQ